MLGPLQTKWVESLESGLYPQGQDRLTNFGRYCCLGVANEVCQLGETSNFYLENTYQKLGLRTQDGSIKDFWVHKSMRLNSLAQANDKHVSFKEVAKFIRENPEKVFQESK